MSSAVLKVFSFIDLLTDSTTNKQQCKYLLQTASERQVNGICEVLYNIEYGELRVSKKDKKSLKSHSKLLNFFFSKKKPLKYKQILLVKYKNVMLNILRAVRKQLLKELK